MTNFNKLIILMLTVCSFSAQAEVNISLHQDLELLVVNKKNVGFSVFGDNKFTLKEGDNQIVVRVSKLISNQGKREKFSSEPVVLTFDLNDANLVVAPARSFVRSDEINGFDKNPVMVVSQNGKNIKTKQDVLERGTGMMRDYAVELKQYNEDNNIVVASKKVVPAKAVAVSPIKMTQNLFAKATATEKEQFSDWAFKNRKSISTSLTAEGKILPMLEYWFEKANPEQRAEIITWIISQ